jgi:uncharacterized membrane protein YjgN (DUF898 family)
MSSVPSAWPDASAPIIGQHWARPSRHGDEEPSVLPIEFGASGSEYFRIWIVNLLLTLVTVGLYYPWARVRKLRYFYGNTRVAGHAFDFHGNPWRMLRGYLLVGALLVMYSLAGRISPAAGVIALLIVAAVWPALLRASQQFRLANTSWRGLRFRFTGSTTDAYRAMAPLFLAAVPFAVLGALAPQDQRIQPSAAWVAWFGIAALLSLAIVPLGWWLLKKYQHDHYALGGERTQLRLGAGSFYGLSLKTLGVMLLAMIVFAVVTVALVAAIGFKPRVRGAPPGFGVIVVLPILMAVLYVLAIAFIRAYATARMQNLVWSRTASRHLSFDSHLRFSALLGLTLKNWLLVALTLGLYWPFAAVAQARLRLAAVALSSSRPIDSLSAGARQPGEDASGDAAGELFGIDIGL